MASMRYFTKPEGRFADRYLHRECVGCGTEFWVLESATRGSAYKWCSRECWRLEFPFHDDTPPPPDPIPLWHLVEGVGYMDFPPRGMLLPSRDGVSRILYPNGYLRCP